MKWRSSITPIWFRTARILGIAILLVGISEVLIALDKEKKDPAIAAYLVKSGPEYLVVWRTRDSQDVQAYRFEVLADALDQLKRIGLKQLKPPAGRRSKIDRLYTHPADQSTQLFWKIKGARETNRLTFDSKDEAQYFFQAFERGSYTKSPYGHAIFFAIRAL